MLGAKLSTVKRVTTTVRSPPFATQFDKYSSPNPRDCPCFHQPPCPFYVGVSAHVCEANSTLAGVLNVAKNPLGCRVDGAQSLAAIPADEFPIISRCVEVAQPGRIVDGEDADTGAIEHIDDPPDAPAQRGVD